MDITNLSFYEVDFESENRMIWELMVSFASTFLFENMQGWNNKSF